MSIIYKGIGHIAFYCNDIAAMQHFYGDHLNFKQMYGTGDDGENEEIVNFEIPGGQYIDFTAF